MSESGLRVMGWTAYANGVLMLANMVALALMFSLWGAYALSGAGVIGQLPLLRAVLITTGVIYLLRSLMLPSEPFKVLLSGYPFRFVVFSTGSLTAGLLHFVGSSAR